MQTSGSVLQAPVPQVNRGGGQIRRHVSVPVVLLQDGVLVVAEHGRQDNLSELPYCQLGIQPVILSASLFYLGAGYKTGNERTERRLYRLEISLHYTFGVAPVRRRIFYSDRKIAFQAFYLMPQQFTSVC